METKENFDIFNLSVSDVNLYNRETKESVLYRPSADAGQDGVYRSLIRFVPNVKNPQKSLVRKFVYWLEDTEGQGTYFDSPSTIGEKCPVQDLFFKLRNSDSAVDKKMSEKLKRREVYYALVQIIKDSQNSDVEGKYKIFKFGYKIKQKIDDELNPQFDEPTQIFDLFEGKNFELTITKQGGFNNYDTSKFQGSTSAITINGVQMEDTQEARTEILESLGNAPELASFDFTPWTDEDRKKVENILNQYRSPGEAVDAVSSTSVMEDIESMSEVEEMTSEPTPTTTTSSETKEEKPASEKEELEDFLEGLDI